MISFKAAPIFSRMSSGVPGGAVSNPVRTHGPAVPVATVAGDGADSSPYADTNVYTYDRDRSVPAGGVTIKAPTGAGTPSRKLGDPA